MFIGLVERQHGGVDAAEVLHELPRRSILSHKLNILEVNIL